MNIHQYLDIIAAIGALIIIFSKTAIFKYIDKTNTQHIKNLSLLAGFSFLGFVFRIEFVYITFDALIGINHLSLLLSRVFLTLCIYVLVYDVHYIFEYKSPKLLTLGLYIVLFIYVICFFSSLAFLPETYYHGHTFKPFNFSSFLFYNLLYVYCSIAILISITIYLKLYYQEKNQFIRLRWWLFLISSISGNIVLCIEAILVNNTYLYNLPIFIEQILLILTVFFKFLVVIWIFAFLPKSTYLFLIRPYITFKKLKMLFALTYLEKKFNINKTYLNSLQSSLNLTIVQKHTKLLDFKWMLLEQKDKIEANTPIKLLFEMENDEVEAYQKLAYKLKQMEKHAIIKTT